MNSLRSTPAPRLPLRLVWCLCAALGLSCTSAEEVDSCADALIGDWESSNEFACPAVDPTCTYRHALNFDGMRYEWYPSDSVYEGPYTCEAGVVEARDLSGEVAFTGEYDVEADTLELSWEGLSAPEPYRRVMP